MPIGEFSHRSGLSIKRLRTYADEGLLAPAAVDPASGYRYYSPEQVANARVIDALRQAGMPLIDIRLFLCQPSEERLDAWMQRLHIDAAQRRRALHVARRLYLTRQGLPLRRSSPRDAEEAPTMRLKAAGRSERGQVRENNEDAIIASDRLAVVADGMGGHPGGEIASSVAAGVVEAAFIGRSGDEIEAAVRAANWTIWERSATNPDLEGMGTTLCAAGLLDDGSLVVVNVGDSRAYLWHRDMLTQLTRDHSVTAELVRRGELSTQDATGHPYYGVLTRALGVGPDVDIDRATVPFDAGDLLVVCSDGLFNVLSLMEIARLVARGGELTAIADNLVEVAMAQGGHDDVSVVVAEIDL